MRQAGQTSSLATQTPTRPPHKRSRPKEMGRVVSRVATRWQQSPRLSRSPRFPKAPQDLSLSPRAPLGSPKLHSPPTSPLGSPQVSRGPWAFSWLPDHLTGLLCAVDPTTGSAPCCTSKNGISGGLFWCIPWNSSTAQPRTSARDELWGDP